MARNFDVVVERDDAGYYVASVPALPGCHTQAKSLDELMDRIRVDRQSFQYTPEKISARD